MKAHPPGGVPGVADIRAFTLLEMLLAVTLMVTAFGIAYTTFSAATQAWRRGTQVADALSEGDLLMERLVSALRSAVYFPGEDPRYGFRHERSDREPPADSICWVTGASGFLPPGAPLAQAAYRIEIALEPSSDGSDFELIQRAWWYGIDEPNAEQIDARVISRSVRGFRVRMFDDEEGDWREEWEAAHALPRRIEVTLLLPGPDPGEEPIVLQRHVEIPMAPLSLSSGSIAGGEGR